jgi:hypothetical protein
VKRVAVLRRGPLVFVGEVRPADAVKPLPAEVALDLVLVRVIRDLPELPVVHGPVGKTLGLPDAGHLYTPIMDARRRPQGVARVIGERSHTCLAVIV